MELGAGGGVGVGAEQVERGLEVDDRGGQLQVAAPAQARPPVQLGQLRWRLRAGERGLEVAGRLVPRATRQRVVARGTDALQRVVVGDRVARHEVVRDGAFLVDDARGARVQVAPRHRGRALVRGVRVDRVAERERGALLHQHARGQRVGDRVLVGLAQRDHQRPLGVGAQHRGGEHSPARGLRQRVDGGADRGEDGVRGRHPEQHR